MFAYTYLLHSILYQTAIRFPDKIAVIVDNHEYTYQTILKNSLAFSQSLYDKQFKKQSRIVILTGNSYATIVAFFGALFAEMVPCIIDSEFSDDIIAHITMHLESSMVIDVNSITTYLNDSLSIEDFHFSSTESDLAMIMHTSGSTGYPKGVMLSHRNVLAAVSAISQYLKIKHNDVILSVLSMHFDYGLYQMLLAFHSGAALILDKNALFPHFILNKIEKYCVTILPCIPLLVQLLDRTKMQYQCNTESIRLVTNTGENLSKSHIQKLQSLFSGAEIFSMYGLTECKRCSFVPPDMLSNKSESIGIPMPNLSMWIEDEQNNVLGSNIEGNLMISGPTVMMGYWKHPEETRKKIRVNSDGKKILTTGDRVIMDVDGYFYFRGRSDHIVKFHGSKFNCYEYAKKIMNLTGVNRAYLFVYPILDVNELLVCVELESDLTVSDHFRKKLHEQFPSVQKPSHFYFTDQFPMLSNGKLNKHVLENRARSEAK